MPEKNRQTKKQAKKEENLTGLS